MKAQELLLFITFSFAFGAYELVSWLVGCLKVSLIFSCPLSKLYSSISIILYIQSFMMRSGLDGAKRHTLPFSSVLLFYQMQAEMSRATSTWVFILFFMGLTDSNTSTIMIADNESIFECIKAY